jgi:hypothetical protein
MAVIMMASVVMMMVIIITTTVMTMMATMVTLVRPMTSAGVIASVVLMVGIVVKNVDGREVICVVQQKSNRGLGCLDVCRAAVMSTLSARMLENRRIRMMVKKVRFVVLNIVMRMSRPVSSSIRRKMQRWWRLHVS